MAVYYDYSIIEEIKYRCDIEDIIASYLPLKRAGSNLNGLCPFHSEKTPSFTVFSHSKSFYCFGCGAGGDVLTFIKRIENIDYPAAIEFLAKRAGISIAQNDVNENETVKKQRIIEMNVAAAKFFRDNLIESKIACDYLSNRNLSSSAIRRFGLGWAPESFNKLTDHLSGLGYSELEMTTGFLSRKSEKNNKMYDLFRGRIIFPIIDVSGNVVAFGGRIIGDGMPKYLNSSDTPAFKKSRNLFALNYAKKNCAENIILCEGYMDVIALHEAGFTSAVATLGTAITAEQARIIKKYTNKVIISYDSDEAGQKAANKAFNLLGEAGLDVSILRMADAKDPDEYIKKYGSAKFKSLLDNSVSRFDFEFSNILAKYNISVTEEKIKAAKDTVDYISNVYSTVERELYINKAAEKFGLSFESIKNDVHFKIQRNNYKKKQDDRNNLFLSSAGIGDRINIDTAKNPRAAAAEKSILGILLAYPETVNEIINNKIKLSSEDFITGFGKKIFDEIIKKASAADYFDIGLLGDICSDGEMGFLTKLKIDRLSIGSYNNEILLESINSLKNSAEMDLEEIIKLKKKTKKTNEN